ncbi:MAG TPA: hypothetical protein VFJ16_09275 [Longimicrobium sp.]|nr:hypothetical protein [Longimicrobium sp.]
MDDIDKQNGAAHTPVRQVNIENDWRREMMTEETEDSITTLRERDPQAFAAELESIREVLRNYMDHVSLRQAAREVGMSATGLSNFVNGADPYVRTARKLRAWKAAHLGTVQSDDEESG